MTMTVKQCLFYALISNIHRILQQIRLFMLKLLKSIYKIQTVQNWQFSNTLHQTLNDCPLDAGVLMGQINPSIVC